MSNFLLINQPGGQFLQGALSIDELDRISTINRRSDGEDSEKNEYVQRPENQRRVSSIEKFALEETALFLTPIVLSTRKEMPQFWVDSETHVEIDTKVVFQNNDFSVIDGQHRLLGLVRANKEKPFKNFFIPVVLVFETTAELDADLFLSINENQKAVSKSVIYDLFAIRKDKSPEKFAHNVAVFLNTNANSPLNNMIKMLGVKADNQNFSPISQSGIVTPLLSLLKQNGQLHEFYDDDNQVAVNKIILNYLRAVSFAFHDIWQDSKNIFIKSVGMKALFVFLQNELLPDLKIEKDLSEERFKVAMKKISQGLDRKELEIGSSYGDANKLADKMSEIYKA